MLLTKTNNSLASNWTRDFFEDFNRFPNLTTLSVPATNIKESDDAYTITVAAPGISKDAFSVDVVDGIISISGENRKSTEDQEDNYTRREYSFTNFKRSFTLPNNVVEDQIKAKYENGELILTIPKGEVELKNQKSIKID